MSDFISREAVINGIDFVKTVHNAMGNANSARACRQMLEAINDIPAADVAPVVRAEWEEDADDITCPVCKNHWNKCDNDTETFDHCPRCGATMLGVKSNG